MTRDFLKNLHTINERLPYQHEKSHHMQDHAPDSCECMDTRSDNQHEYHRQHISLKQEVCFIQ